MLLVNDLPPGPGSGVEVYLGRLVRGLESIGVALDVVGGEITHTGAGRILDVWDPRARRLVAARAEAFGADVVHHHNVIRELSVSVLGATPGRPTVLTVHDRRILGQRPENRGLRGFVDRVAKVPFDRRVARRRVDLTVAVSEPMERELRAAGFPNVVHVPHPADDPTAEVLPVERCTDVLFAGRLSPEKGADVLLEAFLRGATGHPRARLVIVGDGPQRSGLAARARGDSRIEFTGRLDAEALSARLGRARVVVVPSRWEETGPLIAIEAAMHGRPLIASDVQGLRQLVARLGAGPTVSTGDSHALAGALERMLRDDRHARRIGDRARRAARTQHTTAAVAARMLDGYATLVARGA